MNTNFRRLVTFGATAAVLVFWAAVLRPQSLGGPALYTVIRGSSMLPTYDTGDLVLIESASEYAIGDVIAYRVPGGEIGEGHVIVHRIAGGNATSGFVVQGDNNNAPDPWSPHLADIAGKAWLEFRASGGRSRSSTSRPSPRASRPRSWSQ